MFCQIFKSKTAEQRGIDAANKLLNSNPSDEQILSWWNNSDGTFNETAAENNFDRGVRMILENHPIIKDLIEEV